MGSSGFRSQVPCAMWGGTEQKEEDATPFRPTSAPARASSSNNILRTGSRVQSGHLTLSPFPPDELRARQHTRMRTRARKYQRGDGRVREHPDVGVRLPRTHDTDVCVAEQGIATSSVNGDRIAIPAEQANV